MSTRERILDAAANVLRRGGAVGATIRAIAAEAELSEGAVYRHFSAKQDLIRSVVLERVLPPYIDALRRLPARVEAEPLRNVLLDVTDRSLRFYRDVIPLWSALIVDPELEAAFRDAISERRGPHMAFAGVADYLRREQAAGRVGRRIDPATASRLLLGACFQQAFFERLVGPERIVSARELVGSIVDALIAGSGTREDRGPEVSQAPRKSSRRPR